jgi:hypothetical protein
VMMPASNVAPSNAAMATTTTTTMPATTGSGLAPVYAPDKVGALFGDSRGGPYIPGYATTTVTYQPIPRGAVVAQVDGKNVLLVPNQPSQQQQQQQEQQQQQQQQPLGDAGSMVMSGPDTGDVVVMPGFETALQLGSSKGYMVPSDTMISAEPSDVQVAVGSGTGVSVGVIGGTSGTTTQGVVIPPGASIAQIMVGDKTTKITFSNGQTIVIPNKGGDATVAGPGGAAVAPAPAPVPTPKPKPAAAAGGYVVYGPDGQIITGATVVLPNGNTISGASTADSSSGTVPVWTPGPAIADMSGAPSDLITPGGGDTGAGAPPMGDGMAPVNPPNLGAPTLVPTIPVTLTPAPDATPAPTGIAPTLPVPTVSTPGPVVLPPVPGPAPVPVTPVPSVSVTPAPVTPVTPAPVVLPPTPTPFNPGPSTPATGNGGTATGTPAATPAPVPVPSVVPVPTPAPVPTTGTLLVPTPTPLVSHYQHDCNSFDITHHAAGSSCCV